MSPAASTSTPFVVPSVFTWSTAVPEHDLEAQLPAPPAALTRSPRTRGSDTTNAIDDFFGASPPSSPRRVRNTSLSGTRDSRHDEVRLSSPVDDVSMSDALPPPYEHSISPPAYSQVSDQPTLAMYLFKFGFCEYLPLLPVP